MTLYFLIVYAKIFSGNEFNIMYSIRLEDMLSTLAVLLRFELLAYNPNKLQGERFLPVKRKEEIW